MDFHDFNLDVLIIGMTILYLFFFWDNLFFLRITLVSWTIVILLMSYYIKLFAKGEKEE